MTLFALGLNYRSAPLALRERLAIASDSLPRALDELRAQPGVREAAILSTCNRTEIFTVGGQRQPLSEWLCQRARLHSGELVPHLQAYTPALTVRHAMRVAAGLDSMILGEPQILGQMKSAFRAAQQQRSLGPVLTRLFEQAFRVAKQVRSQTLIGARPVSVAAAASTLTGEIFADLRGREILIVGAGDTARLVAEHLYKLGTPRITIANRSLAHAQALAQRFDAAVCGLESIEPQLARADVVVATAATRERLIDHALTRRAFAQRKRKAVLMIDLGVPRNIAPDVAQDEDIYLYTVDDLEAVAQQNRDAREAAAQDATSIIETGARDFMDWLAVYQDRDAILRLRDRIEGLAASKLAQAQRQLAAGADPETVMAQLSRGLTQGFLHHPTLSLRQMSETERSQSLHQLNELFRLDDE